MLLLLGGLAVGLLPGIPTFQLDPEIVFLVVLPPILYVSAFLTPIRDFRSNLKNITSLAVGLVAVSAAAVAVGPRHVRPSELESEAVGARRELRTRGLGERLGLQ